MRLTFHAGRFALGENEACVISPRAPTGRERVGSADGRREESLRGRDGFSAAGACRSLRGDLWPLRVLFGGLEDANPQSGHVVVRVEGQRRIAGLPTSLECPLMNRSPLLTAPSGFSSSAAIRTLIAGQRMCLIET